MPGGSPPKLFWKIGLSIPGIIGKIFIYVNCVNDYMENNLKLSTNYIIKSLFEQEYYYFTVRELAGLLKVPVEKAYTIVARLKDRGFIKSIERGKYLLLGFEPEHVLSNPFFIASRVVYPSYVNFWSALNFYGFTEQGYPSCQAEPYKKDYYPCFARSWVIETH